MAHGDPGKAKLDSKFDERITELEETARGQADNFRRQNTPRPPHTPKDLKEANLWDVPGMHEPTWNRNKINETYAELVANGGAESGTAGGLAQMKIQCDFLAAEERAFRLRHASMVRAACVAHGRLDGHGKAGLSMFSRIRNLVKNLQTFSAVNAQKDVT